jgi:hypothetical protein
LATAASIDNGIGSVATIGSVPIPTAPQSDVTYTLTCEGPNGPVSKQVTLTVNSVRIKEFRINVDQWNNPTLVWEVELAQLVELSCNFSGIVSPIPMVAPKGSLPFANNVWEHIVFTLWAMGPGRSPVTATADNGEIPIPNFP